MMNRGLIRTNNLEAVGVPQLHLVDHNCAATMIAHLVQAMREVVDPFRRLQAHLAGVGQSLQLTPGHGCGGRRAPGQHNGSNQSR